MSLMDDLLPARQHNIVIYLVREFISTAEAVGSSTLMRKYNIKASSATIRNDMVKLEDKGYLYQPYTSAGRVPTDKAYRYYVNYLMQKHIFTPLDFQEAFSEYAQYESHIQNLLNRTCKVLANLTRYTSLILAPRLRNTMFKYLKVTPLEDSRVLLILMTNTGAIVNKVVRLDKPVCEETLQKMTNILNDRLLGMLLGDIHLDFLKKLEPELHEEIIYNLSLLTHEIVQEEENHLVYDGTMNLFDLPEFQDLDALKLVLELLEEEKLVADILKKTISNEGITVYIGEEHNIDPIYNCSLITATYQINDVSLGTLGIIGPKRMDYEKVIPVVRALSKIFSSKLTKLSDF